MAGFDDLNDSLDGTAEESDESEESDGTVGQTSQTEQSDSSDRTIGEIGESDGFDPSELPYKYRRETVKDDRARVDLFVLGETEDMETSAVREIEDHVSGDVSLIDIRDALYRAGMRNLEDAVRELESWGYEGEE